MSTIEVAALREAGISSDQYCPACHQGIDMTETSTVQILQHKNDCQMITFLARQSLWQKAIT